MSKKTIKELKRDFDAVKSSVKQRIDELRDISVKLEIKEQDLIEKNATEITEVEDINTMLKKALGHFNDMDIINAQFNQLCTIIKEQTAPMTRKETLDAKTLITELSSLSKTHRSLREKVAQTAGTLGPLMNSAATMLQIGEKVKHKKPKM